MRDVDVGRVGRVIGHLVAEQEAVRLGRLGPDDARERVAHVGEADVGRRAGHCRRRGERGALEGEMCAGDW